MHSLVIHIRAESIADVIPVSLSLPDLSELLLFVDNVMLGGSNHASILNAFDGFRKKDTSESWVGGEAFPDPTTIGIFTQRTSCRAQLNIDTLIIELFTHCLATQIRERWDPCCRNIDASGESRVEVGCIAEVLAKYAHG